MRALLSLATGPIVTALLCTVCWWLWAGHHGLSHLIGLDILDLQVRVAAIFAFLSLAERILDRVSHWLNEAVRHPHP